MMRANTSKTTNAQVFTKNDRPQCRVHASAGLDLLPLPYESSIGVALRLGWLNALSALDMRFYLGLSKPRSSRDLLTGWRLDGAKLQAFTGWHLPDEEGKVSRNLRELAGLWFSSFFTFCPLCLEHHYHSFWFQFTPLHQCPIHGCKLVTACQSCGHSFASDASTGSITSHPLLCHECKQPMSGAPITLSSHVDIREHAGQYAQAFSELYGWAEKCSRELGPVRQLAQQNNVFSWYSWCEPNLLLRNFAETLNILPSCCIRSPPMPMSYLSWHLVLHSNETPRLSAPRSREQRVASVIPAYRLTIRELHQWIYQLSGNAAVLADMEQLLKSGTIELAGRDAREIAYAWLRVYVEASPWGFAPLASLASCIPFDELRFRYVGTYIQRLPLRAGLLAVFAIFLHMVKRHSKTGMLNVNEFSQPIESLVPVVYAPTYDIISANGAESSGMVLFPKIPGLNLSPFKNTELPNLNLRFSESS